MYVQGTTHSHSDWHPVRIMDSLSWSNEKSEVHKNWEAGFARL